MSHVAIPKDRINHLINELVLSYRVAAPVKDGKTLEFKEIQRADQACLTDEVTYKSPKEFLFPQIEKILSFNETGQVTDEVNEQLLAKKTVLFGVRPCDLEALKVLTAVFTKGTFVDTFFLKHLMNTVIVGLGCINKKPGCFCSERGIIKDYSRDCDIFLTDQEDHYLIEIISDKGEELIKEYLKEYMTEAFSDADIPGGAKSYPDLIAIENKAINSCPDNNINDANVKRIEEDYKTKIQNNSDEKLLELDIDENVLFNNFDWDRASETCIGCGTCTYICPTCHCFDFKDVNDKGMASRHRRWDSCMYPKFTLHASGHNPRTSKRERFRQRVMHKYVYIKKNFGYTACTGCGRCIRSCPAGVNIKSVVKKIMEESV